MRKLSSKYKKLISKIVEKEMKLANGLGRPDYSGVQDAVLEQVPQEVYSYETAEQDIERYITDEIVRVDN